MAGQEKVNLQSPFELRFGVLLEQGSLQQWQSNTIVALEERSGARAECVLVAPANDVGFSRAPEQLGNFECKDRTVARLALERSSTNDAVMLSDASIAEVKQRNLDFILSFAPTDVARTLNGAARWGIWQFFLGNWQSHGAESAGFWEIVDDSPIAFASLIQLQPDPEYARILKQGCIRSHALLPSATRRRLQARCQHWPWQVCLEIADHAVELNSLPTIRAATPHGRRRGVLTMCSFALAATRRAVRETLQELLRHEQWNVGIIDAPLSSLLSGGTPPPPRWLMRPSRHEFFADPFSLTHNGRLTVLCERMDYHQGRGTIVALNLESGKDPLPVDVGPPVHLSYPFLFQHDGHDYCVPETHEAQEVVLYVADNFPLRWQRVATLVRGMPLLDATLFQYGKDWWFGASVPAPKGAECELHLYYADELMGPWRPHPANPVKVDVRSARPGGTPFWHEGALYRPAQDCSRTYGGSVAFNRVVRLTRNSYIEECVARLEPAANATYARGLHTVSAAGNATLVDAKRNVFVFSQFRTILRATMRKAFGISRSP
jgi:hypothetical protein